MDILLITIRLILSIGICFLAGFGIIYVFNRMPAKWLCDYGEEPEKGMWGTRLKKFPYGGIFTLFFACAVIIMWEREYAYQLAAICFIWVLLIVAISDIKYMIIPDQAVIGLALTAIGFIPYHTGLLSPLSGSLLGGGSFLLIGLIGSLILRKEAMGFGDVKLMGAIGLMAGFKGTILILFMAIFSSGIIMGAMLITGRAKRDDQKPLGPYIAGAAGAFVLFRPWLLMMADLYMNLVNL